MKKTRILLLSEGFGTGHTQAAHALANGLKRLDPDIHPRVMELGKFLNPTVAPLVIEAYRKTVSTRPRLVGLLYRKQYQKPLNRITQLALHRIFYSHASLVVQQLRPDAIVCTHPFPNIIMSRLKRAGLQVPLYTLITDYDAHGSWVDDKVNTYLVSAEVVKRKLLDRGVSPDRVIVSGIPVHPKFWERSAQEDARAALGLRSMPTVMFMGGGWGLSLNDVRLDEVTQRWRDRVQFLYCMGSNHKMIDRMKQAPAFQHPNVHIYEFTKEIPVMMDASNLLVTKPGGMTCTEGMLKGIPMLFDSPIPGQEEENCQYFIERGFAQMMDNHSILEEWLEAISSDSDSQIKDKFSRPISREYMEQCPRELLQLIEDIRLKPDHIRN
ncbi:MGDG synthase family glycosyltransferase [Paenibacillus marinisediminis]